MEINELHGNIFKIILLRDLKRTKQNTKVSEKEYMSIMKGLIKTKKPLIRTHQKFRHQRK